MKKILFIFILWFCFYAAASAQRLANTDTTTQFIHFFTNATRGRIHSIKHLHRVSVPDSLLFSSMRVEASVIPPMPFQSRFVNRLHLITY